MRSDLKEDFALAKRFSNKAKLAVLEITKTAVNQTGGVATGSAGDIIFIEEEHLQTA
jgi:hypothetical protein